MYELYFHTDTSQRKFFEDDYFLIYLYFQKLNGYLPKNFLLEYLLSRCSHETFPFKTKYIP